VRPAPLADRDSEPWWQALGRHEFVIQRCDDCGRWRWPARALCNGCGSQSVSWQQASGSGSIASWIVNHHSFDPAFPSPYVVVAVRLAEQDDIVMYGSWAGAADGSDVTIGAAVRVGFDDAVTPEGEPFSLVRWAPADG
jgi:uncharacterized OB-fold protein